MRGPRQLGRAALLGCLFATSGCVGRAGAAAPLAPRTVLLELFTSQGCSSCPAADAFIVELPRLGLDRSRVVPLTFHVDYWNQLGWKDPFSRPAFTARQETYARAGALRTPEGEGGLEGLYTPQLIIDGAVHLSGRKRATALQEIARAMATPPVAALSATAALDGDRARVTVRVTPAAGAAAHGDWRVFLALAAQRTRTNVTRGENGGEVLEEAAVVRALSEPVAVPAGAAPLELTIARPADSSWQALELAVVLQATPSLRALAVRAIPLPSREGACPAPCSSVH
jgi:hypothetical protein